MKITQITKENREYFLSMDPLMMMEYLDYPDTFGLAATVEDEESPKDIPAGLAIVTMMPDSLMINWLCVEEEYRIQGIGEQLLARIFDIAESRGNDTISAYFNQQFGRDMYCAGEEEYFRQRLFEKEKEFPGEWLTDLRTLLNLPQWKQDVTSSHKVISLSKLPSYRRKESLSLLPQAEGKLACADLELSALLYDGDRACGILLAQLVKIDYYDLENEKLIKRTKEVLCPVYLQTESLEDSKVLVKAVLDAAKEKCAPETEVHIVIKQMMKEEYVSLLESLPPYSKVEGKLLVAEVKDYSWQKELEEKLLEFERLGIELD